MKEKVTSSGMKVEPLPSDSPVGTITCKAGNRMCSSLTAENPFLETVFCDICCIEPDFCRDCSCILCRKSISLDYDGYSYIRCETTVIDGYLCGHIAHLNCALRCYLAGTVGGSIGLDAEFMCRYCDAKTDLVPHVAKLLNICTSVASRADMEKILNVGFCILRGSQKRSANQLLHRIESIKAKEVPPDAIQPIDDPTDTGNRDIIYAGSASRTELKRVNLPPERVLRLSSAQLFFTVLNHFVPDFCGFGLDFQWHSKVVVDRTPTSPSKIAFKPSIFDTAFTEYKNSSFS
ncbi:hypothetical protein T459_16710 [Capsicum annuum]|uniref:Oberon-like PHD finger domain-containing protein n=1 Tax=Capsicum annuum TaxID=4072 RepID=A0A2G2Z9I7_CAPAN|nr:hypothetical protein T459_16710 [Capsicum annuum]